MVVAVDTQTARRAIGVDHWAGMQHEMVRKVQAMKGYDDTVKAMVGVAVCLRLQHDGWKFTLPDTDHEADALLHALYVLDEVR